MKKNALLSLLLLFCISYTDAQEELKKISETQDKILTQLKELQKKSTSTTAPDPSKKEESSTGKTENETIQNPSVNQSYSTYGPIGRSIGEYIEIDLASKQIVSPRKDLPFDIPFYLTGTVNSDIYKIYCIYYPDTKSKEVFKKIDADDRLNEKNNLADSLVIRDIGELYEKIIYTSNHLPTGGTITMWEAPSKILSGKRKSNFFLLPIEKLYANENYIFEYKIIYRLSENVVKKIDALIKKETLANDTLLYDYLYLCSKESDVENWSKGGEFANYSSDDNTIKWNKLNLLGLKISQIISSEYYIHEDQMISENKLFDFYFENEEDTLNRNFEALCDNFLELESYKEYLIDLYIYPRPLENIDLSKLDLSERMKQLKGVYEKDKSALILYLYGLASKSTKNNKVSIDPITDCFGALNDNCIDLVRKNLHESEFLLLELKKIATENDTLLEKLEIITAQRYFLFEKCSDFMRMKKEFQEEYKNLILTTIKKAKGIIYQYNSPSTIANFATRSEQTITADVGLGLTSLNGTFKEISPSVHAGLSFSFAAVNRQKPHDIREFKKNITMVAGLSLFHDYNDDTYKNLFGKFNAYAGVGYRVTDFLRLSGGVNLKRRNNDNFLIEKSNVVFHPYLGISLDWDVGNTWKSFYNSITGIIK